MSAILVPPKRGKVGVLTFDELHRLRAAAQSTRTLAETAGVTTSRMRDVLRALCLAYPQGGARPNSGPKPRRQPVMGERW